MTNTIWLLVLTGVLWLVLLLWWRRRPPDAAKTPRRGTTDSLDTLSHWEPQAGRVLTAPERNAMSLAARALPDHLLLAQVPLARFIRVPRRYSYSEWLRRVGQLSPDLLVCDDSSQVIAAIEIRGPEGQSSPRAQLRLERMQRVLQAAGIPLHIWVEGRFPSVPEARDQLLPRSAAGVLPVGAAHESAPVSATKAEPVQAAELHEAIDFEIDPDEIIEMREPPPSTWFDDLDTRPAALDADAPPRR